MAGRAQSIPGGGEGVPEQGAAGGQAAEGAGGRGSPSSSSSARGPGLVHLSSKRSSNPRESCERRAGAPPPLGRAEDPAPGGLSPEVGSACEEPGPETGASAPGVCLSKSRSALSPPPASPEMDDLSDKGNRFRHSLIRQRAEPSAARRGEGRGERRGEERGGPGRRRSARGGRRLRDPAAGESRRRAPERPGPRVCGAAAPRPGPREGT